MMNNQKEVPNNDGSFRIEQKVSCKRDTNVIFHPRNSNLHRAGKQCKALNQKRVKEGAYDDLTSQIKDAIPDQVLIKLSDEEVKNLSNHPDHFCFINYVKQPLSKSTKFRCVVNTSTLIPNISSTISNDKATIQNKECHGNCTN